MRRGLVVALGVVWLAAQILVPLSRKFDVPSLHYRYRPHTWAMFGRRSLVFSVMVFERGSNGEHFPIHDIARYVHGFQSPESMSRLEGYWSVEEVEAWFQRLVLEIGRHKGGDGEYVAALSWTRNFRPGWPREREFSSRGGGQP